jgi:LmbE family N-acetylglucosaminyl deacetylase
MRILLMTAHPDDADIMAGGTVARWIDEGHDVHSAIFTRGDKGHDDPAMTPERVGTHSDHRAVGGAVVDASYFRAPGPLYHPEHGRQGLAPHRVRELLLIMSDHADHVVDIAATFERKVRAVGAHVSQFGKHPDLEGFLRGLGEIIPGQRRRAARSRRAAARCPRHG